MSAAWRDGVGGGLLHPVPLLAIALLALNDHWLKDAWAHPVTGKLSDIAGLVFFPLLLVALLEVALCATGRYRGPSDRALLAAVATTAAAFALVQIAPPATEGYRIGLAALQQPVQVLSLVLGGGALDALPRVSATPDVTDLFALPSLLVAVFVGRVAARRA